MISPFRHFAAAAGMDRWAAVSPRIGCATAEIGQVVVNTASLGLWDRLRNAPPPPEIWPGLGQYRHGGHVPLPPRFQARCHRMAGSSTGPRSWWSAVTVGAVAHRTAEQERRLPVDMLTGWPAPPQWADAAQPIWFREFRISSRKRPQQGGFRPLEYRSRGARPFTVQHDQRRPPPIERLGGT